jgi:hypothetical protein
MPHFPSILFYSTSPFYQCYVKSTSHTFPQYGNLSIILLFAPSLVQILSESPCSRTFSVYGVSSKIRNQVFHLYKKTGKITGYYNQNFTNFLLFSRAETKAKFLVQTAPLCNRVTGCTSNGCFQHSGEDLSFLGAPVSLNAKEAVFKVKSVR